ncbi:hypothetical protein L3X38_037166 [Prunus dulcis]|uniref:Reverse transcriptase Ty1/copia-type domain-containing protein n=1 Tax=Prunus dulcis TaxID=3755 RepID=A0AAD4V2V3_PRUDU|nr:hypothetical protein L3X38_037166 [Prunus dulcis]
MHANCSPSSSTEQFWVADTGATAHMTSNLSQLSLATHFSGNETITIAGGLGLSISSVGSSSLNTPQYSFQLSKFLHVPKISQHLLSVHRLLSISSSQSLLSSSPPSSISFTNTVLSPIPTLSISSPSPPTYESNEPLTALPPSSLTASPSATQSATQSPLPVDLDFQTESLRVVLPLPPVNLHPMTTWSKNGISKRKAFSASTSVDLSIVEPSSFKAASQSPEWQSAMREEIEALHAQARHKARLVAKGFSQEEGIDYYETFSPIVKPTTVRLVLALAAQFQWSLQQLDVKNAFLHGVLQEEVYMTQPQGFENKHHPSDFVCRLKKSLYGLKQAPCAWNERFTSFLPSLGFQASNAGPSLFIQHSSLGTVVLLLYVNDIILTGSNSSLITSVISALTQEFDMKDLG